MKDKEVEEELKKVISDEAQEILDKANSMFIEDARYSIKRGIKKIRSEIYGPVVEEKFYWRAYDHRMRRELHSAGMRDDSCVWAARAVLKSAKSSKASEKRGEK